MRTHEELLEHAGFVRGLARKLAGDTHEDVAQEAWLAALEKPPRHRANVRGWLARVVRNKALMARRAAGRRAVRERSARRTAATVPTDEAVGRLELHELLVRETLALREPYRTALILRYFDGLTPTEIAVRLDVPRRTVETRLRRALAQLRERLDGVCGHAAWAPALLAVAEPARAIWKGAGLVASKLAYAAGGFLLGAAATFTVTETVRPEPPARAPATRRHAELPAPDRERPAAPAPAKADAPPAIRPEHLADHYLRRINDAKNYNETAAVAKEMLTLDAAVSHRVLLEIYERIEPTSRGMRIAQLFAQHPGYPYVTDMLHYCARDGELNLRQWALNLLKQYTLIDFEERPDAYDAWRTAAAGKTRGQVVLEGAKQLADRLRSLPLPELQKELRLLGRPPIFAKVFKEAGLLETFRDIVDRPVPEDEYNRTGPHRQMQNLAWVWIETMAPDETFLKETVLRHARRMGEKDAGNGPWNAIRVLAKSKRPWVLDELLTLLRAGGGNFAMGNAFATLGDKRAIPHLIAEIDRDPKYETIYGLGYFALGRLAGVKYDESHDGKWWLAWWDRNRDRLPADVRALDPRRLR